MPTVKGDLWKCGKCGKLRIAEGNKPLRCSRCKSPYWDREPGGVVGSESAIALRAFREVAPVGAVEVKPSRTIVPRLRPAAPAAKGLNELDAAEGIYEVYPRKVGRAAAVKAIVAALRRVQRGEYQDKAMDLPSAADGIRRRAEMFAKSDSGRRGKMTPHPATWFNRSSYLDDPKEWDAETPREKAPMPPPAVDIVSQVRAERAKQNALVEADLAAEAAAEAAAAAAGKGQA